MKKKVLVLFLLILLIPFNVHAETIAQKRKDIANLKAKYQAQQSAKKKAQNNISSDQQSIKNKESEINSNQQKLTDAENESAELTKEIADGKKEISNIMEAYQVAQGDNVYLEYVFEATSYEDLVYRYAVMEQVMSYMKDKINGYEDKIKKNDELIVYIKDRKV